MLGYWVYYYVKPKYLKWGIIMFFEAIMLFLLMSTLAYAYVEPIEYRGTQVRIYNDKEPYNVSILDYVNSSYFNNIRGINILTISSKSISGWYTPNVIYLDYSSSYDTIIHEFVHHVYYQRNRRIDHSPEFWKIYNEMRGEIYGNIWNPG